MNQPSAPGPVSASAALAHARTRPAGISPGAGAFVAAWIVGAAIARLTGAAAVLLLLAIGVIGLAAAVLSAFLTARRLRVASLAVPAVVNVDTETTVTITLDAARIPYGSVRLFADAGRRDVLATISLADFTAHGDRRHVARGPISFKRPGIVERLHVEVATAGATGLMWFRHTTSAPIDPVNVAPVAAGPLIAVETVPTALDGTANSRHGPRTGDIDGVRPWRKGEGDGAVHWPSTMRSGSLIVHDRTAASDRAWTIEAPEPDTSNDEVAGRLHHTMLEGLRQGHDVSVAMTNGDGTRSTRAIRTPVDAQILSARYANVRTPRTATRASLMRRNLRIGTTLEDDTSISPIARWLTALASFVAFAMLIGALGSGATPLLLGGAGLALGAATSMYFSGRHVERPVGLRVAIWLATVLTLLYIASGLGGVSGLLAALRGPMPDLLMVLAVLHGFETIDRRTLRVHQAIGAVVMAYATGLRIDDRVGWWMAAWSLIMIAAVRTTSRPRLPSAGPPAPGHEPARSGRGYGGRGLHASMLLVSAAAATFALLSVVPVPDGPARLGLPALAQDAPTAPTPGGLAGPGGGDPAPSDGTRGALGQVGGYPGFSETLDTSVRGDLGDEIVMRVRAPEPAFWRGQTFTEFDGTTWTVSPERGTPQRGPRIDVTPTLGDGPVRGAGVAVESFLQTYYVEADLPNVVFAASTPRTITFDGSVWTRPDGALRSDVALTAGSVYTVESERVQVSADVLRAQGDISAYFGAFTDPVARQLLQPFLDIPASTSQRTIDLASSLRAPGQSTYDTILAYQVWLATNTEYDLNAPVPRPGEDAVDDFLFESRRGFCEQIASSLAIMLRSQGVPARIATGYIPGVRDRVSGVFEVRASDAHAWVEVWFPDTGWEAFDPTANVPLAGDATQGSVGAELIAAAISSVAARPVELGIVGGAALGALSIARLVGNAAYRRRRGRWGLLQDRFRSLADRRPAHGGADPPTNPSVAQRFSGDPAEDLAADLAATLDRVAFDPTWADDDEHYAQALADLQQLQRS